MLFTHSEVILQSAFIGYTLDYSTVSHYRRVGSPTSNPEKFVTEATEIDLSTRMELIADVVYRIQVSAMNSIGESNSSNEVSYTRLQGQLI